MSKYPELTRVLGRDKRAAQLLQERKTNSDFNPCVSIVSHTSPDVDYAQVDPALTITEPTRKHPITMPDSRVGYGGLTPQQRHRMLKWLDDPLAPAPKAIQHLYVAQLETNLFEEDERPKLTTDLLAQLLDSESWHWDVSASRAILLGLWLAQEGEQLESSICRQQLPTQLIGTALGQLALMGGTLSTKLLRALIQYWLPNDFGTKRPMPSEEILSLRLASLTTSLGQAPLPFSLTKAGENAAEHKPWRCTHRDLRIAIPQPNLEPYLRPLIEEALDGPEEQHQPALPSQSEPVDPDSATEAEEVEEVEEHEWTLVLEFGHSRSEYFDFAIFRARQRPRYSQIMDEDRTIIHRIIFAKPEMRHFWLLWEYVQNWSSTHVYVNGQEVEKWKVWPYSQHLR